MELQIQILSDTHFFVFWYICWEMSTQRQFDLCMGPDTNETDCRQNTLHVYVKFIRKDKHITSIKNLRPKVACSLSRGLQWNSMHSQIWWWTDDTLFLWIWWTNFPVELNIVQVEGAFSELDELDERFCRTWWTYFRMMSMMNFQPIRMLSCSCSRHRNFSRVQKARVWLNFEQNARVGQISLRGFSENGVKFRTFLLTFPLENFFRELVFRLMNLLFRCDEHENFFRWTWWSNDEHDEQFGWTWNSDDEHESFLMIEHESFSWCSELSLFCLWTVRTISPAEISESERRFTKSVLSTVHSPLSNNGRMLVSANQS